MDQTVTLRRIAIITDSVSHFEVPMFRLLSKHFDVCVFYRIPIHHEGLFDPAYQRFVTWGEVLTEGYTSRQCSDVRLLIRALRAFRADAYLVYGYAQRFALAGALFGRIARQPVVFRGTLAVAADPRRPQFTEVRYAARTLLLRWLFTRYHVGGAFSEAVLQDAGIGREEMYFVPYSVDSVHFLKASATCERTVARRSLGFSDDDRVVLYIGQLVWVKSPLMAAEVFLKLRCASHRYKLVVVGSGPELERMREALEPMRDHVRFVGFCPSKETVPFYVASDIVLFTSRYETWARSVNEAMLCARPCVVNRSIGAAGGLVDESCGYVVDGRASAEVYAAVIARHFDRSEEERASLGIAAQCRARVFSYEANQESMNSSLS